MDPLAERDFGLVVENLEDLQDILSDVISVLAQSQNITAGYMNKDEPEEESKISKSVRQRAEQAEMKKSFDAFLNKVNTQNIYNESEDQSDQEATGEEEL